MICQSQVPFITKGLIQHDRMYQRRYKVPLDILWINTSQNMCSFLKNIGSNNLVSIKLTNLLKKFFKSL